MISYPLSDLYRAAGLSKQAVHQARARYERFEARLGELIAAMDELRAEHPGCGLEKAYFTLRPAFLGRDRFIALFQRLGYACRRRLDRRRTTRPGGERFENLIEGHCFDGPNQLWQSDLTYVDLGSRFGYVVFLIDVYTKVIVGYAVSGHMRAEANVRALRGAIRRYGAPAVHHSDRGSQYSSGTYVKLLGRHKVQVSMGQEAAENAYAERVNGTIKNEYLSYRSVECVRSLGREVKRAVAHYNAKRLHNHLGRMTPLDFLRGYPALPAEERPVIHIPILSS